MKQLRVFSLLFVLALVAGCGLIQPETPKTPREALAYSYVTVDSLADVLRVAKRDGHVTAAERDELADQLQNALDNLADAEAALVLFASTGDPGQEATAEQRLSQAQSILTAVESILKERAHE